MGKIIQKLLIFFIGFVCCLNFDFILAMKPVNKISSPGGQRPILPLLQGSILPHTVINLWPSERALSKGVSLCNQVPGIICITPDEKAVITTHNGKVFYCSFSDEKEKKLLFELPQAKHSPMITMAQKKDGLFIVAAGNYIDAETDTRVGEYVSHYNGCSKVVKSHWPFQQIALNPAGSLLAIAGEKSVEIVDCATDNSETVYFRDNDFGRITDVVMSPHNEFFLVATSNGIICFMSVGIVNESGAINVSRLQKVSTHDYIKKIYWPTLDELLYVADNSEVKFLETRELIEPFREVTDARKQLICVPAENLAIQFSYSPIYDLATADMDGKVASAHWTNSNTVPEDISHVIEVYRKSHKRIEKLLLTVPQLLSKRYDFTTSLGQIHSAINHLWMVTMRNNCVVALRSSGQLLVWSIVKKQLHKKELARGRSTSDNDLVGPVRSLKREAISSRRRGSQPPIYSIGNVSPREDSVHRSDYRVVATSEPALIKKNKSPKKIVTSGASSPRRSRATSPSGSKTERQRGTLYNRLDEDASTDYFIAREHLPQGPQNALDVFGRTLLDDVLNDAARENS